MKNKYFIGFVASFFIASAFSASAQDTLRVDTLYHIQATPVNVSPYRARIDIRGFVSHFVLDQRYGGNIADTSICVAYAFQIPGSSPPEPIWDVPPSPITSAMLEPGSDSSFTWHIYLGPGSRTGTFNGWVELCHYEGGFYGPSWWWQWITFDICNYQYTVTASPGELDPFPVEFDFCDANYDTLPTNYVVGFEDTLYIKIEVPRPESVSPYSRCALICMESQQDTFYYDVPVDSTNPSVAKGKVFPAKTLGGDTQIMHGFSTVHGYVFKGDSIYGEDWIDVGQLFIIVRGTTPGTLSNSFLSTNQLEFEAVTRSHSGITVTPNSNSIIWGTVALNDTSGSLSPNSGRGRIFHSIPNPKNAPYTRGEALAYKCSCSVNYPGVGAQDWVILRQDERDQLIQEYIDTQKPRFPARSELVFSVGSYIFPDEELRSSDYNCFAFSDTLLNSLVRTRCDYGHALHVFQHDNIYRAYLSPNNLFLTKPQGGIGSPNYWENDSESLHVLGYAADIQVLDHNGNGRYRDDWDSLAAIMTANGINPVDMGDSTYIHAIVEFVRQEKVQVAFDRDEVAPGCEEKYSRTLPEIVRRVNISGSLDSSLSPYLGRLELSVVEVPLSGGHDHVGRPIHRLPEPSEISQFGTSGAFGNIRYQDLCLWGGRIAVHAYYITESNIYHGSDTLTIRFTDLGSLGFTPDLVDEGGTPAHSDNHYVYGSYESRIQEIAENFNRLIQQQYPDSGRRQLYVNDSSLIYGGQFDIGPRPYNQNWKLWAWPHQLHRDGCNVDLSFQHFSRTHPFRQLLRNAIISVTSCQPETHGDHIHARLGWREWPR